MMRPSVLFALLFGAGLCLMVQASKHHHADNGASLLSSFMQQDVVRNLHPQHLKVLQRAVKAFEGTIDQSKLSPTEKDAVKQRAVEQFKGRLAQLKRKGHGH